MRRYQPSRFRSGPHEEPAYPSARSFPGSLFRSLLKFIDNAAPAAAGLALPALLVAWGFWSAAHAATIVTTVTGTITGISTIYGTTTDGHSRPTFGMAPGTPLAGMNATIVYTTNDQMGATTSSATSSSITSTGNSYPTTALVTIGRASEAIGDCAR